MWRWRQYWTNVLFLHWRVDNSALRPYVPAALDLDTWQGDTWLSVVLFGLRVRPAWLPFVPGVSTLVEMNLRAYVRLDDIPGIYFLHVHADNPLSMWLANRLTPMRYEPAHIEYRPIADTGYWYDCRGRLYPTRRLALQYRPIGLARSATEAPLDSWLLERYRLYIEERPRGLCWADVEHPPWNFQRIQSRIHDNTLGNEFGLSLSASPDAAHFSPGLAARFGTFRSVHRNAASVEIAAAKS